VIGWTQINVIGESLTWSVQSNPSNSDLRCERFSRMKSRPRNPPSKLSCLTVPYRTDGAFFPQHSFCSQSPSDVCVHHRGLFCSLFLFFVSSLSLSLFLVYYYYSKHLCDFFYFMNDNKLKLMFRLFCVGLSDDRSRTGGGGEVFLEVSAPSKSPTHSLAL